MITKEQVDNVINMLQSPDPENHILALAVLEAHDPKTIEATLMICFKFGHCDKSVWLENAPKCLQYLQQLGEIKPYTGFSFQQMFTLLMRPETSPMELEIFFRAYGKYLSEQCANPEVESIEITVKFKGNDIQ